ncbi:hypothetical protein E2C01_024598 [Portunus trituberculatus]|uniref:Uncharacterized protein n=1 Tax=Portunus trituberculatus TaxID=210409 RepID=A0A5B7EB10_PORTR|nr:hypothetical protein [Portunus trituberculatus]
MQLTQWVYEYYMGGRKLEPTANFVQDPPKRRCLWYFASASWGYLRRYYADFSWNEYCFRVRDPSLCAERITEAVVFGVETDSVPRVHCLSPDAFIMPKVVEKRKRVVQLLVSGMSAVPLMPDKRAFTVLIIGPICPPKRIFSAQELHIYPETEYHSDM